MKKPVIGISTSVLVDQGGEFPGYERIYVNKDYVSAVIDAGAVPLMIPMEDCEENLRASLELVDGIIFSGGQDIAPYRYGEEPHVKLQGICPERDEFDFLLYRLAKEKKLPILGICRGYQLMNVAEGGSLYQDLSLQAIKEVPASLSVSGRALDDVIEAIELKDYPFGIGVQFHPEMLQAKYEDIQKIFLALVEACKEYHNLNGKA